MDTALLRRQPRRVVARALALSGTALLAAALLAWTPQPTAGWDQSSAEATLWQLLNGARVNNGLAPLINHTTLVSLARWRSQDMVDRDYFSHTVLDTSWNIFHWYDSNGLSWSSGGENIGFNSGFSDADSPVKIHEGFMNSPGHRANLLNSSWSHGGVGAYGADGVTWGGSVRDIRMYTELFILLKSASPPPPPPTPAPTAPPSTPKPTPKPTPTPTQPPATPKPTSVPTTAPIATPHQTPLETADPETPTPTPTATAAPSATPATVGNDGPAADGPASAPLTSMRVETAVVADRGIFESVIGALLSFLLG